MSDNNAHLQKIEIVGVLPIWYTGVPNMAIYDLPPNEYKLLAVYMDMAAENLIYARNETVAERLGRSINTMKSARANLAKSGYIEFHKGTATQTARVVLKLGWMWKRNKEIFQNRLEARKQWESNSDSQNDNRVSNSDSGVSNSDTNQKPDDSKLYDSNQEPELIPPVPADENITPEPDLEENDSENNDSNGSDKKSWDELTDNQKTHRMLGMYFGRFTSWYKQKHGVTPAVSIGDLRARMYDTMHAIASHDAQYTVKEFIDTIEHLKQQEWFTERGKFPTVHNVAMEIQLTRERNEVNMDDDSQNDTSNFSGSMNWTS